jgi:ribonuclease VapC
LILDSSAVLGVLFEQDDRDRLLNAMMGASAIAIGSPTLLETVMVAAGKFDLRGRALVAQFLDRWNVVIVPFGEHHSQVAVEAFLRYGKGRHPAGLNYGDCMTYATARLAGAPLLFVGDDFAKTDIAVA